MLVCSNLTLGKRRESVGQPSSSGPENPIQNNVAEYQKQAEGTNADHSKFPALQSKPGNDATHATRGEIKARGSEEEQESYREGSESHEKEGQDSQEEEQFRENDKLGAVDVEDAQEDTDSAQEDGGTHKKPNPVVLQLSQGRSGSTVTATLTLEAHPYCGFFIDELVTHDPVPSSGSPSICDT